MHRVGHSIAEVLEIAHVERALRDGPVTSVDVEFDTKQCELSWKPSSDSDCRWVFALVCNEIADARHWEFDAVHPIGDNLFPLRHYIRVRRVDVDDDNRSSPPGHTAPATVGMGDEGGVVISAESAHAARDGLEQLLSPEEPGPVVLDQEFAQARIEVEDALINQEAQPA